MPALRLFLSHGVSDDPWNGTDRSETWVAQWFKAKIAELSGGQIEVITCLDYRDREDFTDLIRHDIAGCDAVLCVFTCRHENVFHNRWFPSHFVVSESGFAAGRYWGSDASTRLFAFVEKGVDVADLGIAFAKHVTLPSFAREKIDDSLPALKKAVDQILSETPRLHRPSQLQRLDKEVTVFRSGAVLVISTYELLITREPNDRDDAFHRERHFIWRVREPLPQFQEMISTEPNRDARRPFLHCRFLGWTGEETDIEAALERDKRSADGKEIGFDVVFRNLKPRPGGMLRYELSWAYPGAFRARDALHDNQFNSVGLRAGCRHSIRDASLTVRFERNYARHGEELPIFEQPPRVLLHESSLCPYADRPQDFWYAKQGWQPVANGGLIRPNPALSNVLYEVYRFQKSNFSGHARMQWVPSENYHISEAHPHSILPADTAQ